MIKIVTFDKWQSQKWSDCFKVIKASLREKNGGSFLANMIYIITAKSHQYSLLAASSRFLWGRGRGGGGWAGPDIITPPVFCLIFRLCPSILQFDIVWFFHSICCCSQFYVKKVRQRRAIKVRYIYLIPDKRPPSHPLSHLPPLSFQPSIWYRMIFY